MDTRRNRLGRLSLSHSNGPESDQTTSSRRRRSQLGGNNENAGVSSANLNAKAGAGGFKMPASKSPGGDVGGRNGKSSRMSMGRASLAGRPSLSGRPSLLPQNSNRRQSTLGRGNVGNSRRSSVYGAGMGGAKIADPRPIGNKQYTQQNIKILVQFLTTHAYEKTVTPKMMASPTGKEFRNIISFLFRKVDPNFEFGGNFEEEVKTYLKLFGYPFSVSKAALTAVGSPHTWPGLLAALVWLCEYLTYYNETSQAKKEGENNGNFDSLLEGDENYHIFYRCTADSYAGFLEGNDNYTSLDEGLANTFEEKNDLISNDIELLGVRNAELKKEIELLSNTQATIEELETKKKNLASDNEKFQSLIANLQDHKLANEKLVQERLKEQGEKEKKMETLAQEKGHLQELLHQQKFTPMEVQEMAHQKAMLQETVTNLDLQKQELTREIWDAEITNAKVLGTVESKVNEFNKVALDVGILPATSKHANGIDLEVKLTPLAQDHIDNQGEGNEAIAKCEDLVNLNLTKVVKPALRSLKLRLGQQIADEQTTMRESGDAYSESTDSKIEQEEKVKALSARINKLDAQLKKEKEGGDDEIQRLVSKVEVEEVALNEIRSQQESALMASGKDVANLNNLYMQQQQILKDERDTLLAEIHTMSERVLKHKMTIGGILRDFENGLNSMREDESS